MTMRENPLRGAVAAKFGTCAKFSEILDWPANKVRRIVSGKQIPNASEITQMAKALDVMEEPTAFMRIFFGTAVHNVD